TLDLEKHPEGGFYREIFRSTEIVYPEDKRGDRSALTTIFFLLTDDIYSRWHRIRSDEVWHLYEGGPLELFELDDECQNLKTTRLVSVDAEKGRPVHVVEAGVWQAARSVGPYALMGCTVGPGYDDGDFELLADSFGTARRVRDIHSAVAAYW